MAPTLNSYQELRIYNALKRNSPKPLCTKEKHSICYQISKEMMMATRNNSEAEAATAKDRNEEEDDKLPEPALQLAISSLIYLSNNSTEY
jgi:hypothetical protein